MGSKKAKKKNRYINKVVKKQPTLYYDLRNTRFTIISKYECKGKLDLCNV